MFIMDKSWFNPLILKRVLPEIDIQIYDTFEDNI